MRFRRALSLAINRHEINMAVFYGLGRESADTVLPREPAVQAGVPRHGMGQLRSGGSQPLLDEMGLDKRDADGSGSCPTAGWQSSWSRAPAKTRSELDVLELVRDHWKDIGL